MVTGLRRCGHIWFPWSHGGYTLKRLSFHPSLSPMLLSHNFSSLGGIPSTFWEQSPSVQSIPTDSFSVEYGAHEKPNDFPGLPRETLEPHSLQHGQQESLAEGGTHRLCACRWEHRQTRSLSQGQGSFRLCLLFLQV